MKNLLVPIDFSECSNRALEYAVKLAKLTGSQITLMHAVQVPILEDGDSETGHEIREEVDRQIEKLNRKVDLSEVKHTFKLSFDSITTAIRKLNKKTPVDLIVMGTTGASGAKEIFLGSNTYETIQQTQKPVLAVPVNSSSFGLGSIAFASDYKAIEKYQDLDTLIELSKLRNSEVHILHIGEDTKISRDELAVGRSQDQYFKSVKHSYHFINGSNVAEEINRYIKMNIVKILALYARKHDLTDKLFHHSVTQEMTYHTEIPLLVLPESD